MSTEAPLPEKKPRQGAPVKFIAIATLGLIIGEQILLNIYPEIHNAICLSAVALVGGGVAIQTTRFISKVVEQKKASDAKYYEAYPEQSPAFKKAAKEKAKAEKEQKIAEFRRERAEEDSRRKKRHDDLASHDQKLLNLNKALLQANKNKDEKLTLYYSRLIAQRIVYLQSRKS